MTPLFYRRTCPGGRDLSAFEAVLLGLGVWSAVDEVADGFREMPGPEKKPSVGGLCRSFHQKGGLVDI